jgi:SH3 domain-containing YSC84-like protein 1
MRKAIVFLMMLTLVSLPLLAGEDEEREDKRLENCGKILNEILNEPEHGMPQFILDRAYCVIMLPGTKKGNGFIFTGGFGGTFGRGAMTCRTGEKFDGPWGAPTMVALEGVTWGLALGGASADILVLVMNDKGASSILTSKTKLGGDVTATAGPVGRDAAAESDAMMKSELLTFARAKGLFAGAQLSGSTLRADGPANEKIYGKKVDAKDVVLHGSDAPPAAAKLLLDTLNQRSPKKHEGPKPADDSAPKTPGNSGQLPPAVSPAERTAKS